MYQKQIPVTIITGFFGSGKTTLLNHLVESYPGKKFAVIKNELTAFSIDELLITGHAEHVTTICNGCICCTAGGLLTEAIINITSNTGAFDHIIIETAGSANVHGIISFLLNEYTRQYITLRDIICVVNSLQIGTLACLEEETQAQIAAAGVVVLNNSDLAGKGTIKLLEQVIREINQPAEIVSSITLCNINKHTSGRNNELRGIIGDEHYETFSPCKHYHHPHIISFGLNYNNRFDFIALQSILKQIEEYYIGDIYYIKGVLCATIFDSMLIIQSVGGRSVWQTGPKLKMNTSLQTNIIFVGKNLDRAFLQRLISKALIGEGKKIA